MVQTPSGRQLAVIMFTDMVGYSALVQKDEALAMELLDEHRRIVRKVIPGYRGREVETAGDSFLIVFGSALEALNCAVALQKRHAAYSEAAGAERGICIRVGLHVGDIEHRRGGKVFGDGVNLAARIEPLAPAGGVSLSAQFHAQVRHRLETPARSLGPMNLKNISEPMEVWVLEATAIAGLPDPQPRPKLAALVPDWRWAVAGVAILILALALPAVYFLRGPPIEDGADKSIAVLPFADLSEDKQSGYFADGVHDAIITNLARASAVKVISRTSVMEYREQARNLKDIGKALGVANIVEGSVQRVGGKVRVTAQLIKVSSDQHLWAQSYDRDMADIFSIQSDVAKEIVASVHSTLTDQERKIIGRLPTSSTEAYDFYLRARSLLHSGEFERDTRIGMEALLLRAVELDPDFALALALLARIQLDMYWQGDDPARRELAFASASRALQLDPTLPEGHAALAQYYYHGFRDYPAAEKEIRTALQLDPNSVEALQFLGYVLRRQAKWPEALTTMDRVIELDPQNMDALSNWAETLWQLRQYPQALAAMNRAERMRPELKWVAGARCRLFVTWKGDIESCRQLQFENDSVAGLEHGIWLAVLDGRIADAEKLIRSHPGGWDSKGQSSRTPKELWIGQFYLQLAGDRRQGLKHMARARELLEADRLQRPDDAWTILGLAQVSAAFGHRAEAQALARRAESLLPVERDAIQGADMLDGIAVVYILAGLHEEAIDVLERLVLLPGGHSVNGWRRDPYRKAIHDHPRFKALVAKYQPEA